MRTLAKKVTERPLKNQFKTQTLNKFNQFSGRSRFSTIRRFVLTFRERSTSKMFCPWLRFGRSHDLPRRKASVCCFRTHVWFWCHCVSNHPSPMKILENPSLQLFLTLGTCAIWIFRRFFSLGPQSDKQLDRNSTDCCSTRASTPSALCGPEFPAVPGCSPTQWGHVRSTGATRRKGKVVG